MLDRAGILSPDNTRALEQRLTEFETKTGHQIVVHITPSLEGLEIEDYSIRLAEAWKVGQKDLDNGVILTIAPVERRARIEVGYGLEGVLPDALGSRIINDVITPEFRAGRMDEGVRAGTLAILDVVSGEVLPLPARRDVRPVSKWVVLFWIAFVLLILFSRGFFFSPPFGGSGAGRVGRMGRTRGGRALGRGGFGGFGGGGFGGGGASGSW